MNDQVPRMNESIAMVKANVTLLEKEEAKYKNDLNLTSKIKAAIQARARRSGRRLRHEMEQLKGRWRARRDSLSPRVAHSRRRWP